MRPQLATGVETVVEAVTSSSPAFAEDGDSKLTRDVHTAVRVALERFLDLIGTRQPALPPVVREVFVALGAAEAREDRGPQALLTAFRAASRVLLRMAAQAFADVRPTGVDELIDLSEAISVYVDELAAAGTDGFARQVREQAADGDRRRQRLGELLLRGGAPGPVVRSAAAAVGWPGPDVVVPVLLPPDQARHARFRYGGDGVVLEREHDAVLLLRHGPRTAREQLGESLAGRGAVVGPALDWVRVPEGVRLAELVTGRPGLAPDADSGPIFVEDHLAALALRGEPGALAVLSRRRLAPLSGLTQAQRDRLLSTLHSWLRHWGSRAEVSAELYVHPQTVSYRLKRLRELLGESLDDPTVRFELLLVLAAQRPGPARDG
jgi:hypothetical protein